VSELFDQIESLRQVEGRAALATLVSTHGTTPRKEGAKMWVGVGGRILGSVTIGGCVDAEVMAEAEGVLEGSRPKLLSLDLGDEDAWEIGLTCGGTIEVFLEPVALGERRGPDGALALYETLRSHVAAGGSGAILTRMDPPDAGAKLLLLDDGRRVGSLGDPGLDEVAPAVARGPLSTGVSRTVGLGPGEAVRCFVEVHLPPPTLLVVGASHVAMPLVTLARPLGYRTVVVDGRPRLATRERFPDVDELSVGIPSELVRRVPLGPTTALVLVAHDYKYDLPVLRHALSSVAGYIGMLGSRRRGDAILRMLREEGITPESLARIRVPIGLDLGGRTAPEIALAILAEIVASRYGGTGRPLALAKRAQAEEAGGMRSEAAATADPRT
jgi:xanthine dehydrogenase accessory factor